MTRLDSGLARMEKSRLLTMPLKSLLKPDVVVGGVHHAPLHRAQLLKGDVVLKPNVVVGVVHHKAQQLRLLKNIFFPSMNAQFLH